MQGIRRRRRIVLTVYLGRIQGGGGGAIHTWEELSDRYRYLESMYIDAIKVVASTTPLILRGCGDGVYGRPPRG